MSADETDPTVFSDGLYTAQNAVPESDAVGNFRHFQSGVFVLLSVPEGFHDVDVEACMFAHGAAAQRSMSVTSTSEL